MPVELVEVELGVAGATGVAGVTGVVDPPEVLLPDVSLEELDEVELVLMSVAASFYKLDLARSVREVLRASKMTTKERIKTMSTVNQRYLFPLTGFELNVSTSLFPNISCTAI